MRMTNLSAQSPAQIDAALAEIHGRINDNLAHVGRIDKSIERQEGILASGDSYRILVNDGEEAIRERIAELQQRREDLLSEVIPGLHRETAPYNAEFDRRGGWTRIYLVDNSNGHVHTSMNCRNCYSTTQYYWVTELSGSTQEEVVAQAGARTCLTCFPDVREDIIAGRPCTIETPAARAAREEREAKAAAKAAKAAKTGITNPDGTPLMRVDDTRDGGWRETSNVVKTEVAANRNAMEAMFNLMWYSDGHPSAAAWRETVRRSVAALAHKRGTSVEGEQAAIHRKVSAKYQREMR